MIRKKRNKILAFKDNAGNWVTDKENLKDMGFEFFRNLYAKEDHPNARNFPLRNVFPKLNSASLYSLNSNITSQEIKDAVFSMGALKALGPDGYHAMFFQSHWEVIGDSVCEFIMSCFQDLSRIDTINSTDVVLIPKVDNPDSLKQFRPISLCNVIYKAITEVIANRLKPLLNDIISPTQCSYILRRHSSNNVIIAQEVIHSMINKKGQKGFVTIKVDLEKAYDHLDWDFLVDTLNC